LRKGKRVIPILAQSGTDIPLHLETKNYRDLTGTKPKPAQLNLLLKDIQSGNAQQRRTASAVNPVRDCGGERGRAECRF
jgi:hypothetical protein